MNLEKANHRAVALGDPDLMAACQIALYNITPAQAALVILREMFDLHRIEIASRTTRGIYILIVVRVWTNAEKWTDVEAQGLSEDTAMVSLVRDAVKRETLL